MSTASVDPWGSTAPQDDPPFNPEPFPGLFRDDGAGAGTYLGRDGRERRCTYREARERAREEGIILTNRWQPMIPGWASGQGSPRDRRRRFVDS